MDILKEYFGYNSLKPEQEEIIDNILNGKDVIGLLPTGYGKSLTYQIPALLFDGLTIVISPLISLMQDQVEELKEKFIRAEYINSLLDRYEIDSVYNDIKRGRVKILYVSAERLLTKRFIEVIQEVEVSFIVCDEAHTLLWSEDFRFALGRINEFIKLFNKRPKILAVTATATNNTIKKIKEMLELKNPYVVVGDADRKNIFYNMIVTKNKDKDLLKIFGGYNNKAIIYCLTIKACFHVREVLKKVGIDGLVYHGKLTSKDKKRTLQEFKEKKVGVVISTMAFGLGINISNIRLVVLYDIPSSIEDFQQETGRGSRDGEYAEAVMLFNLDDIKTCEYFISNIEYNNRSVKEVNRIKKDRLKKLDSMVELCFSRKCIHKKIANYFGISHPGNCNMCSSCFKGKRKKNLLYEKGLD